MPTRNTILSIIFVAFVVLGGIYMVSIPISREREHDRVQAALNELRERKMLSPFTAVPARDRMCEADFSAYLAGRQGGYAKECAVLLK